MPYLKPRRITWCEGQIESCKRNGWRHAIYTPQPKQIIKGYYKGQWRNDKKEGKGIEVNSHGWMYEGNWFNNQRHGYGVLSKISKDGEIQKIYAGDWLRGKKDGFGNHWYKDNNYYEGAFRRNKRDGYGRIWYNCGEYYQGIWLNNRYHGEGILIQENGNRYEGQFMNGKKEGRGIFYHLDSGQLQNGRWENDVCVSSTIEDTDWRQLALHPTTYPIPRINAQALLHL